MPKKSQINEYSDHIIISHKKPKDFILVVCFHSSFQFHGFSSPFHIFESNVWDKNEATQCVGKCDSFQYNIRGWKLGTHKVEATLRVTLMPYI